MVPDWSCILHPQLCFLTCKHRTPHAKMLRILSEFSCLHVKTPFGLQVKVLNNSQPQEIHFYLLNFWIIKRTNAHRHTLNPHSRLICRKYLVLCVLLLSLSVTSPGIRSCFCNVEVSLG